MNSNSKIVLGTRGSRLALAQAHFVQRTIAIAAPAIEVRIEIIKTTGDVMKSASLTQIGGQGVFTKELEEALLASRIDLAVHSLKDLPSRTPDGLLLAAIPEREDPRDALVLPLRDGATKITSLRELPANATIGTSSPRRLAQLKHLRPDLNVTELRGNVDTRLRKLDAGDYDAIILAAAGLKRLNLESRISLPLSIAEMLPAVGQAALGLEVRADDMAIQQVVKVLNHQQTHTACLAERSLLRHLGGGCQLPIAGFAEMNNGELRLRGLVAAPHGNTLIRNELTGIAANAERIGEILAKRLLRDGAARLLPAGLI